MKDLSWAWPEAQRVLRDMQRAANKERFFGRPKGQMLLVDEHFAKIEERFITERAKEYETDRLAAKTYDNTLLNIVRWHEVTMLLLRTDNKNVKAYIKERALQPLKLPSLSPKHKTNLDILIENTLKGKFNATAI